MYVYMYIHTCIHTHHNIRICPPTEREARESLDPEHATPCEGEVLHTCFKDASRETPDVTPCRTSPPLPIFRTCLARNARCNIYHDIYQMVLNIENGQPHKCIKLVLTIEH